MGGHMQIQEPSQGQVNVVDLWQGERVIEGYDALQLLFFELQRGYAPKIGPICPGEMPIAIEPAGPRFSHSRS